MVDIAIHKSKVRAWLFQLLASLETCEDVEAGKTESAGNKVTIVIQFKV